MQAKLYSLEEEDTMKSQIADKCFILAHDFIICYSWFCKKKKIRFFLSILIISIITQLWINLFLNYLPL